MRVALIYPEVYDLARFREGRKEFPPFGVLYLAAILRRDGFDVDLMAASQDDMATDLRAYEVIGVSVASSATVNLLAGFLRSALIAEGTPILAGGVHATFYPEETLQDLAADIVCFEEADLTISELMATAASHGDLSGIPGLLYTNGQGQLVRTHPAGTTADLNVLPLPARDLLPRDDLIMDDRLVGLDIPMAHVMFSRGCPFPCAYCAAGNTASRYRSGESAYTELASLVADYGIGGFAVVDDNFIVRKRAVSEIASAIAPLGLRWSALSRVDTVNEPLLETLAAAGCVEIKYGIESGSEWLLQRMKKNISLERIERAVSMTTAAGIRVKAFIIHGFPGENLATTEDTVRLLDRLRDQIDRVSLFRFVPLPGTSAYDDHFLLGIRGTHLDRRRWDGDWSKFHIHHNDRHWWGSNADFVELQASYERLSGFVSDAFGDR
jgi:anaerobic magnesium-protoporphyrin IX monomethyl ester cyclase